MTLITCVCINQQLTFKPKAQRKCTEWILKPLIDVLEPFQSQQLQNLLQEQQQQQQKKNPIFSI